MLSDAQWARISDLLPGKPTDKGGRAADNRQFVEAGLFRRLATRYDKLAKRFSAFLHIACAYIWLL
jgi:transposase